MEFEEREAQPREAEALVDQRVGVNVAVVVVIDEVVVADRRVDRERDERDQHNDPRPRSTREVRINASHRQVGHRSWQLGCSSVTD